jgi:general secretion pathway protein A
LRQLSQRVVARYHLGPLSKSEVAAYVQHRLEVSGAQRQLFPSALMGGVYRMSGGVPRLINLLCDRALLGTFVQGKARVDRKTLRQAAAEVFHHVPRRSLAAPLLVYLIVALGGALALTLYQLHLRETALAAAPAAPPAPVAAPAAPPIAVPVKQPEPVAALPDRLEWPAEQPRARSKELAYAALFQAWSENYEGKDACGKAEELGLRCRSARGGLEELRQMNRPAVLALRDAEGKEFFATLAALDDKAATFAIGAATRSVALGALAAQWAGQYTLLWRMPRDALDHLFVGVRGPAVQWLTTQLAQAKGQAAPFSKAPLFDDEVERQVKEFQLAQGLVPDGLVGPQTLMRLAAVGDRSAPQLSPRQGER